MGMNTIPQQFAGVTVVTKANVYFDGEVVSRSQTASPKSKRNRVFFESALFIRLISSLNVINLLTKIAKGNKR
jgi:hypothetical protein